MSDNSKIEWTEASWNPVTGCTKVSPGCDNCYAETFAERWRGTPGHHFEAGFDLTLRPERLDQPLRWRRPRRIFVNSMSDLFHDGIPDEFIGEVFTRMGAASWHTFQVLTKRHGRMRSLLRRWTEHRDRGCTCPDDQPCSVPVDVQHGIWPLPNVWLGVSVEDQRWADIRVPALLDTPAAVRWLSCEPLLGPVQLHADQLSRLDWIVVGGESGPSARPMHPDWARSLRDQCRSFSVPFFFKQWGEWKPAPSNYGPDVPERARPNTQLLFATASDVDGQIMLRAGKRNAGRELDGRTWDEYPGVREPAATP